MENRVPESSVRRWNRTDRQGACDPERSKKAVRKNGTATDNPAHLIPKS